MISPADLSYNCCYIGLKVNVFMLPIKNLLCSSELICVSTITCLRFFFSLFYCMLMFYSV